MLCPLPLACCPRPGRQMLQRGMSCKRSSSTCMSFRALTLAAIPQPLRRHSHRPDDHQSLHLLSLLGCAAPALIVSPSVYRFCCLLKSVGFDKRQAGPLARWTRGTSGKPSPPICGGCDTPKGISQEDLAYRAGVNSDLHEQGGEGRELSGAGDYRQASPHRP